MPEPTPSPAAWVPLLQALVAREMVEEEGLSLKRASGVLGVAPSAISQYLSGKRQTQHFAKYSTNADARRIARQVAERLLSKPPDGFTSTQILLEGAGALAGVDRSQEPTTKDMPSARASSGALRSREMSRWLRQRIRAEQAAVTACMTLAQRARDELTRAIFRQIASDSLRHAEIVASLATYLDRGISGALASGVSREDIEELIASERKAESQADSDLARQVSGTLALLVTSMESDERKHAELLEGMLRSGFELRDAQESTKPKRLARRSTDST